SHSYVLGPLTIVPSFLLAHCSRVSRPRCPSRRCHISALVVDIVGLTADLKAPTSVTLVVGLPSSMTDMPAVSQNEHKTSFVALNRTVFVHSHTTSPQSFHFDFEIAFVWKSGL